MHFRLSLSYLSSITLYYFDFVICLHHSKKQGDIMRARFLILLIMISAICFAEIVEFEEVKDFSEIKMNTMMRNSGASLQIVDLAFDDEIDLTEGNVSVNGWDTFSRPNNPQLPQYNYKLTLDGHFDIADVSVIEGKVNYASKSGEVNPAMPKLLWNRTHLEKGMKSENYSKDSFYPGNWLTYNSGFDGKKTHVYIHVLPIQWNPVSKEMVFLKELKLEISGSEKTTYYKSNFRNRTEARHIIVTPDAWIATADSIAEYNTGLGISSETLSLSEISTLDAAENPNYDGYATHTNSNIENYEFETAKKLVTYVLHDNFPVNLF
jgi:hypothetical protein